MKRRWRERAWRALRVVAAALVVGALGIAAWLGWFWARNERFRRCNEPGGFWDDDSRRCHFLRQCPEALRAWGTPSADGQWCVVPAERLPEPSDTSTSWRFTD